MKPQFRNVTKVIYFAFVIIYVSLLIPWWPARIMLSIAKFCVTGGFSKSFVKVNKPWNVVLIVPRYYYSNVIAKKTHCLEFLRALNSLQVSLHPLARCQGLSWLLAGSRPSDVWQHSSLFVATCSQVHAFPLCLWMLRDAKGIFMTVQGSLSQV